MVKMLVRKDLELFKPGCTYFVGVDSDGCVFDTMSIKQREHFFPLIRKYWQLEKVSGALLKSVEFVNLKSRWRGQNRFPCLLRVFEVLAGVPGVCESGTVLPATDSLRRYCHSGLPLGNDTLKAEVERTDDPELRRLLEWSLAVNRDIAENMALPDPFEGAGSGLELMAGSCDVIVVSQTPSEALAREWRAGKLDRLVRGIAGQEAGSKAEVLTLASSGRYLPENILMIGDAPGDYEAARAAGALFYPITPGQEEEAWKRLSREAFQRFVTGRYAGAYSEKLIAEFEQSLPAVPDWQKTPQ